MMVERPKLSVGESFFGNYTPEYFSSEEARILGEFFTNTDKPVFVGQNLPPPVIGALIGRHSQSPDSMRRIFLNEFVYDQKRALHWAETHNEAVGISDFIDLAKADELIRKHFVGYGHDSLVATIPLIIGFERVSQLGAKGIENVRIGLSPIERSTRYGFFGDRIGGKYLYARSPVITNSPFARLYERVINDSLDLYAQLQEPVGEKYRRKFPDASGRRIRQMTFDATRVLLVAANYTNLGAMVNGQAAENMIIKLRASELAEHQELGQMIEEEISQVAPTLMERVKGDFGSRAVEYLCQRRREIRAFGKDFLSGIEPEETKKGVQVVGYDPEGENKVIASILWPGTNLSEQQVLEAVRKFTSEDKLRIVERYLGERPDRRSKPGRAFEEAPISFQLVCRFAEWRDLQRNRMLTPHWRLLDYSHGIDIGEDLEEFGYGQVVKEKIEALAEAHSIIAGEYPVEAQYLVAFGALMPYLFSTNVREVVHISELRTDPGGHKDYARHASDMAKQVIKVYPLLEKTFQFVNYR